MSLHFCMFLKASIKYEMEIVKKTGSPTTVSVIGVSTETNITHDKQVGECITKSLYSTDNWSTSTISTAASAVLHSKNISVIFHLLDSQLMPL